MFNRINPGADRGFNAGRAMGVGGDPQAPLMRLIGNGAQLIFRKLLLARFGIAGKDTARGAHFNHFCAIFALAADFGSQTLLPIGHAFLGRFKAGRQESGIAVPARRT